MKRIFLPILALAIAALSFGALAQDKADKGAAGDREARMEQLYKSGQVRTITGKVIRMMPVPRKHGRMNGPMGMPGPRGGCCKMAPQCGMDGKPGRMGGDGPRGDMGPRPEGRMNDGPGWMDGPPQGMRGPRGRMGRVIMLVNTGEAIEPVMLGPGWFLRQSGLVTLPGDEVTVSGSIVQLGNKPVMLAEKVTAHGSDLTLRDHNGLPVWGHGERDEHSEREHAKPMNQMPKKSDKQ